MWRAAIGDPRQLSGVLCVLMTPERIYVLQKDGMTWGARSLRQVPMNVTGLVIIECDALVVDGQAWLLTSREPIKIATRKESDEFLTS
jgi:hypothetical protein